MGRDAARIRTGANAGGLSQLALALLALLALLGVLVGITPAHAGSEGLALQRVERLVSAARTLNYDATFVYSHDGKMDEMRIIHRFAGGVERERLVTLSGSTREVLRDDTLVTCIIPDNQTVVVGKSRPQSRYGSAVLTASGYREHYELTLEGSARAAGRRAEIVAIRPRDEYRYGYRLWVDGDSGLLLRSELVDGHGSTLESIIYTSLRLPDTIPDRLLEPEISGRGFSWYTSGGSNELPVNKTQWVARWLPAGFKMRERESTLLPAGRMPLEHLVYGDGLAALSIYIEKLEASATALDGVSKMGAMSAFGTMIEGYQVTVVGEVPGITVEKVGISVVRTP